MTAADLGRFLDVADEAHAVVEPGTRLAGRYRVVRLVARGAIGEVYEAFDEELRERVALKTLRRESAHDPRALERFKREVQLARRVTHANACRIFELGLHRDGDVIVAFLIMEFLEGETLADRLARGPALTSAEALGYARQIAAALAAVHAADLVHRDLKPANVMLVPDGDRSRAVVTDFGLVRSGAADASGTSGLYGTPDYMAPEQKRGEPVTPRSDVYSFGVVFSEMLAGGEHPVLARCLAPEPADRFPSGAELQRALTPWAPRAIATWAAVAVAVVGVLASVGVARRPVRAPAPVPTAPAVKRIAVLPFENAGSAEDDYLTDGIADELRGRLAALSDLQVIARGSSIPFKKTPKTPVQIAQELHVRYLLTATVRADRRGSTGRVRVSPELVEVSGSGPPVLVWQQASEASVDDVLRVESAMAEQVARALGLGLQTTDLAQLADPPTRNPAAYQAFLRGESILHADTTRGMADIRRAGLAYENAIALDPSFADAWARKSWIDSAQFRLGPRYTDEARAALEKARASGPDRAATFMAAVAYLMNVEDQPERALAQALAGLQRHPDHVELLANAADVEGDLGDWETAAVHLERAREVDPLRKGVLLAQVYMNLGRWKDAAAELQRIRARHADGSGPVMAETLLHVYQGDLEGAHAAFRSASEADRIPLMVLMATTYENGWVLDEADRERLLHLGPDGWEYPFQIPEMWRAFTLMQATLLQGDRVSARRWAERARRGFEERARQQLPARDLSESHTCLAYIAACLGRKDEALRHAAQAEALADTSKIVALRTYTFVILARAFVLLDDHERALGFLERAPHVVEAGVAPAMLRIDPNFAPLRGNPRFERLVSARWP